MVLQSTNLVIDRCPHCRVDTPNLTIQWEQFTSNHANMNKRFWSAYLCKRCGGIVITSSLDRGLEINEIYPEVPLLDDSIPERAREYLKQAIDSLYAPSGSIMLSASSVDSMLKAKGYKDGQLYSRIKKAAEDHIITNEMAQWAHQIRLDANEQRHADDSNELPNENDAKMCIDFAFAFAEYLFVLPAKINKGIEESDSGN